MDNQSQEYHCCAAYGGAALGGFVREHIIMVRCVFVTVCLRGVRPDKQSEEHIDLNTLADLMHSLEIIFVTKNTNKIVKIMKDIDAVRYGKISSCVKNTEHTSHPVLAQQVHD